MNYNGAEGPTEIRRTDRKTKRSSYFHLDEKKKKRGGDRLGEKTKNKGEKGRGVQ